MEVITTPSRQIVSVRIPTSGDTNFAVAHVPSALDAVGTEEAPVSVPLTDIISVLAGYTGPVRLTATLHEGADTIALAPNLYDELPPCWRIEQATNVFDPTLSTSNLIPFNSVIWSASRTIRTIAQWPLNLKFHRNDTWPVATFDYYANVSVEPILNIAAIPPSMFSRPDIGYQRVFRWIPAGAIAAGATVNPRMLGGSAVYAGFPIGPAPLSVGNSLFGQVATRCTLLKGNSNDDLTIGVQSVVPATVSTNLGVGTTTTDFALDPNGYQLFSIRNNLGGATLGQIFLIYYNAATANNVLQ